MRVIPIHEAKVTDCVRDAQKEGVVLTRAGKPVALVVGVIGMDLEQIELGQSDAFWKLIRQRRQEKTISREELEKRLVQD